MKQKSIALIIHLSYWTLNIVRNIFLYEYNAYSLAVDQLVIASVCYFNYFILFPYILKKNKWNYYLLWFLCFSGLFTFTYSAWTCTHFWLPFLSERSFNWYNVIGAFNMSFLYGALSSGARLIYDWEKNQKKNRALEVQKKNNELKSMKSNMNIPLLLETLNYTEKISALTPSKAETPILLLSEVLRYGLYECDKDQTSLQQEVSILSRYIQLQNEVNTNSELVLNLEEMMTSLSLPPGIILHFITSWGSTLSNYSIKRQIIDISYTANTILVSLPCQSIPSWKTEAFIKQFKSFSDEQFNILYRHEPDFIYLEITNLTL